MRYWSKKVKNERKDSKGKRAGHPKKEGEERSTGIFGARK